MCLHNCNFVKIMCCCNQVGKSRASCYRRSLRSSVMSVSAIYLGQWDIIYLSWSNIMLSRSKLVAEDLSCDMIHIDIYALIMTVILYLRLFTTIYIALHDLPCMHYLYDTTCITLHIEISFYQLCEHIAVFFVLDVAIITYYIFLCFLPGR